MISDRFDIQAATPAGTPAYTPQQHQDAAAPQLQAMLRSLLEDRFKVVLHRDKKEMRVYELSLAPEAVKFSASDPDKPKCQTMRLDPDENRQIVVHVIGNKVSAEECAYLIEPVTGIPVLNRTGFTGDFSIDIEFATVNPFDGPSSTCDPPCGNNSNLVCAASPTISTALQSQLGLELALNRGSVDIWMIDGAENPSGK